MTVLGTIAVEVDLRPSCPAVRDQGRRSTCLACAASDAHTMEQGSPLLSAEWLFYHAIAVNNGGNLQDGILFEEAAEALANNGQPAEAEWPYPLTQPDPWVVPNVTTIWHGTLSHSQSDAEAQVVALLRAKRPVILGLAISPKLLSPAKPASTVDGDGPGYGGHAVLAVGLGECTKTGRKILIRNSWGSGWGDGGHAWLAASYLIDKLLGYAPITVTK